MAIIEITRAENVRRYTRHTLDTEALTPEELAYIDRDGSAEQVYELDSGGEDTVIESILKEKGSETIVDHGDCDDRNIAYIVLDDD
jgi:hypothetical protein